MRSEGQTSSITRALNPPSHSTHSSATSERVRPTARISIILFLTSCVHSNWGFGALARGLRRGAPSSPVRRTCCPEVQRSSSGTTPVVYEGAVGGGEWWSVSPSPIVLLDVDAGPAPPRCAGCAVEAPSVARGAAGSCGLRSGGTRGGRAWCITLRVSVEVSRGRTGRVAIVVGVDGGERCCRRQRYRPTFGAE
jgi:hypothetical protein